MTAVTPKAPTVNQGATLSVTRTVKNQGSVAAVGSSVAFRLSPNTFYGDADDVVINTGSSTPGLAAGASNTATLNLTIPAATPPNTYHVCAKADRLNAVIETDETNNTLCSSTTVIVPPPDLTMTAVSTTATAVPPGKTFTLSNTVKNQGGSKAGPFTIAFHLSLDATYGGTDDIAMTATRSLTSLAIGASSTATTTLTVPATTPLGPYYVCAMADSGGTVNEGPNENNNSSCIGGTIQVTRADLAMMVVTPNAATVARGSTLSVGNTVQNQGLIASTAFRIGFRLSVNDIYGDSDDVVITTIRSLTSLAAGASSSATTSITVPGTTPVGTYFICAMADSLNAVVEADEGNNTLCSGTTVTVQ
jgi:subtilase family serine protease